MPPHAREVAVGAPVAESPRGVAAGDGDDVLSFPRHHCCGLRVAACAWPPARGRLRVAALCEQIRVESSGSYAPGASLPPCPKPAP
jgi:hypothetical protein